MQLSHVAYSTEVSSRILEERAWKATLYTGEYRNMPKVSNSCDVTTVFGALTLNPSFVIDIGDSVSFGDSIDIKPQCSNLLVGC